MTLAAVAAIGLASTPTRAQADPGTRALEYLQSQQSATDGSLAGGFGVNELYVIGAAAGGYDPSLLSNGGPSVMDYLSANAAAACPAAGGTGASAGGCGELIQAVEAAARDPHAFGGLDLVSRLTAYFDTTTGRYGDGEAFTQALAVQGLLAAAQPVPAAAVAFLQDAEDSDGGWDFQDVKDDPNAATNFDTSDSNSTAMVLMALDAAGDHNADSAALTWLHTMQNTDGGFSFQGGGSDPDSTALALQAIIASGGNPAGATWTVSGHTPRNELVATQDPSGGFTFPGNPGPDTFTTSQVPPALFGRTLPVSEGSALFVRGTPLGGQPPAPSPTAAPPPTSTSSAPAAGVVAPAPSGDVATPPAPAAVTGADGQSAPGGSASGAGSHSMSSGEPIDGGLTPDLAAAAPATPRSVATALPAATPGPTQRPSSGAPQGPGPAVARTPAPAGGFPAPLLYVVAGVAAAAIVGSAGFSRIRR